MQRLRGVSAIGRGSAALATALVLALVPLAACSESVTSAADSARTLRPADVNATDVMFVQMMIPHHQQAVEMAALAPTRADNPTVKALARRIAEAQGPEIDQMRSWLKEWGVVEMTDHSGHLKAGSMKGIISSEQMTELKAADGAAFDRLFLKLMIEHHEGAIDMARDGLANGEKRQVRKLEQEIVDSQVKEIGEMKALLRT